MYSVNIIKVCQNCNSENNYRYIEFSDATIIKCNNCGHERLLWVTTASPSIFPDSLEGVITIPADKKEYF